MVKVCQALVQMRSSERVVPPSRADVSDGSESFVVSKPCRRYRALAKSLSCRSSTDGRTITKALHKRADRPGGRG